MKLSVLENGSDVDLIAYNLFSVATIWSVLQESSSDLKPQDIPLSSKEKCNTNKHLPEKSIFSTHFPQINPSVLPTVQTVYMSADNPSTGGAVFSACVFWGEVS